VPDFIKDLISNLSDDQKSHINKFIANVRLMPVDDPANPDNLYGATFDFAVPVAKTLTSDQVATELNINNSIEEVIDSVLVQAMELCPTLCVPYKYLKKFTEQMGAVIHRVVTNDPIYQPYFYTKEEFDKLVKENPIGSHTKMMIRLTFLIKRRNVVSAKSLTSSMRPTFLVNGKTHEVIRPNGYIQMGKVIEEVSRPW